MLTKGTMVILYHRTDRHRTLKILIDTDNSVAINVRLPNGQLTAPCDLTGSETNKKKPMRIRFHPSTMEQAADDEQLAIIVEESAFKLIDQVLGTDWSREPIHRPDVRLQQLNEFRQLLGKCPLMVQSIDRLTLSWPINGEHIRSFACPSFVSALTWCISSDGTLADFLYEKDDIHRHLLRLQSETAMESGKVELLDQNAMRIVLNRSATEECNGPRKRPAVSWKTIGIYDGENTDSEIMMLTSPSARIEQLKRSLEASIVALPSPIAKPSVNSASSSQRRPLTVVLQNATAAIIQISAIQFTEIALTEEISSPLRVMVTNNGGAQQMTGDNLASSPAESYDSGVSSAGSEGNSSVQFVYSGDLARRQQNFWRHRSVSECGAAAGGLKGILKWRQPVVDGEEKTMQPKAIISRSVSECGGDSQGGDGNRAVLRCLNEEDQQLDKEDGDVNNGSSVFSINDDTENENAGSIMGQKKRVSFSERVQERSFRPNSSILGQRRKNQRKAKCKNKKLQNQQTSSDSEQSETTSRSNGTTDESGDDHCDADDIDGSAGSNDPEELSMKPTSQLQSRQDSGISAEEEQVARTDNVNRRKEFIVSGPISLPPSKKKAPVNNEKKQQQQQQREYSRVSAEKRRDLRRARDNKKQSSFDSGVSDDEQQPIAVRQ